MNVFPDPAEIVVDGGPIPAAAAIAADGGDGGAAAAVGGHLTLNNVRDGVVSGRTSRIYLGDIIVFLNWCSIHQVDWLTEHGSDRLHAIQVRRAGESNRAFNIRIRTELHAVLRDANQNPVIHLDRIQPERFIEFILTLRRAGTNRYLEHRADQVQRYILGFLFPGSDQEDRFGEILASILRQREADVRQLGFEPNTIARSEDDIWVDGVRIAQFPMVSAVPGFGRLTRMCLASLLYHRNWITDTLIPNHVVRVASTALRSVAVMAKLLNSPDLLVVSYPWNDAEHSFSGIPPHASFLQEMTRVRADQRELIDSFIDKVKEGLDQFGVNGAQLTEHRLRQVLEQFEERIRTIEFRGGQGNEAAVPERVETGAGYTLHMYGGGFHRVPADWRFPRCGVQDLWRQWWIGDTVRQVPPLRSLEHVDVKHLDNLPLADDEMHGRTGGYGARRRLSKKTLCDMRFLMNWMTERVEAAGHRENNITISAVDRMFLSIAHLFADGVRDSQKRWTSIVHTYSTTVFYPPSPSLLIKSFTSSLYQPTSTTSPSLTTTKTSSSTASALIITISSWQQVAAAATLKNSKPPGANGGRRYRSRNERTMDMMKEARKREALCSLCLKPGHRVVKCPKISEAKATLIGPDNLAGFTDGLGDPMFCVVEEPCGSVRETIKEWMQPGRNIPVEAVHVVVRKCFYSATRQDSSRNVVEVFVWGEGGIPWGDIVLHIIQSTRLPSGF
ncbi:hypothetical protein IV203_021097 [Nitzschia inconspicua]|uniref:Uncharacterized protein n=1 Tax=Nitzschia inconspicua TaxID=303405 RepID=A0A9K3PCZ2_9STRA|nr:hypothetical protein IV203_021097 [Nitzschia inconspicua]